MADKKISDMTAASAYTGTNEFYEMVQGGSTRQGSHALLKTYFDTVYAPVTSVITSPVAWTPTFTGFGTVSNVTAYSWRVGAELFFEVVFTSGTSTAVEAQISLGYNGTNGNVTTASTYPTLQCVGAGGNNTSASVCAILAEASKTYICIGSNLISPTPQQQLQKLDGNAVANPGWTVSLKGSVRIQGW